MRILVLVEPRFPIPPEMMPGLLQGFAGWRERYRSEMEAFEFFVGGGGYGIINVADEVRLNQIMLEFPFTTFSRIDCRPTVNGDTALRMLTEAVQAMAGR